MSQFDTSLDAMFRAVPLSRTLIDLNKPSDAVVFRHLGCTEGTIQISRVTGPSGTWRLDVERSNDGSTFEAMPSSTQYNSAGIQNAITLTTEYTRVRVTTPQGADATAVISMYARA